MDYLGHLGCPDLSDAAAARAFFRRIDAEFQQPPGLTQGRTIRSLRGLIEYPTLRGKRVPRSAAGWRHLRRACEKARCVTAST